MTPGKYTSSFCDNQDRKQLYPDRYKSHPRGGKIFCEDCQKHQKTIMKTLKEVNMPLGHSETLFQT